MATLPTPEESTMASKYGIGKWGTGNRSLNIEFEAYEWFLTIRRTDSKEDVKFGSLDQKEMSSDKTREFIPKWENLDWQHGDFLGIQESSAIHGDYKLILTLPDNVSISIDDAIQQFRDFMSIQKEGS